MEPTGLLSLILLLFYALVTIIAYDSYNNLYNDYRQGLLLLVGTLCIWGAVSSVAYLADTQCLPYSGALECYYEN